MLSLDLPPWVQLLEPLMDGVNSPSLSVALPPSVPPSPPGNDNDYVDSFLETGEGALDSLEMSEAEAPSSTSREPGPLQSFAMGLTSLESDSFRRSIIVDVPSEFRVPVLPN
eukprot:2082701-Pleurochrysis_carterae.AAC.1